MKKLREIRTRIDAYIQTHKPAAFIMWLLVLLFPLWLSLSGNAISFLSGEDGAAATAAGIRTMIVTDCLINESCTPLAAYPNTPFSALYNAIRTQRAAANG